MSSEAPLSTGYVKDYYNAQVGVLSSYTEDRWHSSPVRAFEYTQTVRALTEALSGRTYTNAVEAGPGDGVFTKLIRSRVIGRLHLIEQSKEMLSRAKIVLTSLPDITYEEGDFLAGYAPEGNDLVIAIRCFEYFPDKLGSLKKMYSLLNPGGRLIIVTKNPEMVTSRPVQHERLHSDQVSRTVMQRMAKEAGFIPMYTYPAVLRMKATLPPMRFAFDLLHRLSVALHTVLPFSTYATESYVYVFKKPA